MPVLRFHLLTITHEQVNGSVVVTITTNAACHLYLRYSDVFPRIHRKSVARRGLVMGWDARYCFAAYQHLQQDEEGDTFTHTFTWPGWANCDTRYFYFWGTMGGQDMVSDTPIFWIHYLLVEEEPPEGITIRFYPDLVTTTDGWANRDPTYEFWPAMRNGLGTGAYHGQTTIVLADFRSTPYNGYWGMLQRGIVTFPPATIPEAAVIIGGAVGVFGFTKEDTLEISPSLGLYKSWPLDDVVFVPADYQNLGNTLLAPPIAYNDFDEAGENIFTLNALGLANISRTENSRFAFREVAHDAEGPSPPWKANSLISFQALGRNPHEELGPYLDVTYQLPA